MLGFKNPFKKTPEAKTIQEPQAFLGQNQSPRIYNWVYSGEKNPGEMGVIKKYSVDHYALRNRAWQAFMDSDMSHAVIKKYCRWVIGSGLKLQSQPVENILKSNNIKIDLKKFKSSVEANFRVFCSSKTSVFNNEMTLNQYSFEAYKNAITGGDVLVIIWVDEMGMNIQCIDADHIQTPTLTNQEKEAINRGHTVDHGVELDKNGKHIAYFVCVDIGKFERIKAHDDNGMRSAYLVYGSRYRLDNVRGIPIISAGLEAIKKLDRYKEASIGSAEQRAKVSLFVEHDENSTGKSPLTNIARASTGLNSSIDGAGGDSYSMGQKSAEKITATTPNTALNLPPGATIKTISSDMELNYSDFLFSNLQVFCAAIGMPFEVALSKFDSNYSASRAAIKDWEHVMKTERSNFSTDFFGPIYKMWLLFEDARGNIDAPGLFISWIKKNVYLFEAYTTSRFIGPNVPHIDPVKEVKAIREKLGEKAKDLPLTTMEQATEELSTGDYDENIQTFSEELELGDSLLPKEESLIVEKLD